MKKATVIILVLSLLVCWSVPGYAALRADRGSFKGKVVSVSDDRMKITVTDGDMQKTFKTKRVVDNDIQRGSDVVIIYRTEDDLATLVRPVVKRGRGY